MREQILTFPSQLSKGAEIARDIKIDKTYEKVVICGMGGSIMPGLMLLTYKEHKNKGPGVPIIINNNYDLSSDVDADDLVICISWSGTTEETISAFKTAVKRGIKPVAITKGGELGQLAKDNNTPLVVLPDQSTAPRLSVGYMVGALFTVLGLEKELDIALDPQHHENTGKELADKIGSATPLIYTSYSWRKLGALWKSNFNETAKTPAYWNYLPILAHDELAMYIRKDLPFYPIIFKDERDLPRYIRDLDAAIAILDKQEYNYSIVNLREGQVLSSKVPDPLPLEIVLNNYILGLWTSFYLAQKIGVDPEKIELIERYKELKKG
ncbi:MAG: SIS domain-containing protein [Candidatus Yanofskybacteria bacterium]|nr:SIS domain-containing protein [Candidatus Yanofskybacteria bacterium]